MKKHRRAVKNTAIAGVAIATSVGLGTVASPNMAQSMEQAAFTQQIRELRAQFNLLAESNTEIVGAPSWLTSALGGGGGVFAPSGTTGTDIYNLLSKKDQNPLVGWGTGGVALAPQWNTWYNLPVSSLSDLSDPTKLAAILPGLTDPTKDQYYTPAGSVQTGTEPGQVRNDEYYDTYADVYDGVVAAGKDKLIDQKTLTVNVPYSVDNPVWKLPGANIYCNESRCGVKVFTGVQQVTIDNPYYKDSANYSDADVEAFLAGGEFTGNVTANIPIDFNGYSIGKTQLIPPLHTTVPVPYDYKFKTTDLVDNDWTTQTETAMATDYPNLHPTKDGQIPVYNEDGYWTTTTSGQWVSPTDYFQRLEPLLSGGSIDTSGLSTQDLFYFAKILGLSSAADLGSASVSDIDWQKLSMLAPVLNWTTYIQNTNLIGYGDGNIAIGDGYRQFIQAVEDGTIKAGPAQTDGRYLTVKADDQGNPVVTLTSTKTGEVWDYPLPNDPSIQWPQPTTDADSAVAEKVPGGVLDLTLITMALLRNPGRPNGGLYSRFAPIYEALYGVDPVSPERTDILPDGVDPALVTKLLSGDASGLSIDNVGNLLQLMHNADGKKVVVTIKADATWAYDILSDAPVTANPVAWANSAAASLLVLNMGNELLGAAQGQSGSAVGLVYYVVPEGQYDAGAVYATLTTDGLPLLAPLRLPANAINAATGSDLTSPVADALEPVLKILTNIGYTDVVTPEQLANGTVVSTEYSAYDRTYLEMNQPTLFGTQTLKQSEIAHLQGDLITAVSKGASTGWNESIVYAANKLLGALNVDSPEVTQILQAPGDLVENVGTKVGSTVSDVLVQANGLLPQIIKTDDPNEQKNLAAILKPIGQGLKPVKDGADQLAVGLTQLDQAVTKGQLTKLANGLSNDPVGSALTIGNDLQKQNAKLQARLSAAEANGKAVTTLVSKGKIGSAAKKVAADAKATGNDIKAKVKEIRKDVKTKVKKATGN